MSMDDRKLSDYNIGQVIGKGTFGSVRLGMHIPTREEVAIKILEKNKMTSKTDLDRIYREINITRKLRHPNIAQLYEIIETPSKFFLVTEHIEEGELFDAIVRKDRLDEVEAGFFFEQLASAVSYLQSMGICHRDLKPQNLLLDWKSNIKIVDFGLSNTYDEDQLLYTACGSPCYAAPQMLIGEPYDGSKSDIWSCGVILFAMLCGFLPFQHDKISQLYSLIKSGIYEEPKHLSAAAKDLLRRLLCVDPDRRITWDQVKKHPFLSRKGILAVQNNEILLMQPERIILKEMEQMGVSVEQTIQQLRLNKHNKSTATYHLLLKGYLRERNQSLVDYYITKLSRNKNLLRVEEQDAKTGKIKKKMQRNFSNQRGSVDLPSLKESRQNSTRSQRKQRNNQLEIPRDILDDTMLKMIDKKMNGLDISRKLENPEPARSSFIRLTPLDGMPMNKTQNSRNQRKRMNYS